jgi:hypothetical protein
MRRQLTAEQAVINLHMSSRLRCGEDHHHASHDCIGAHDYTRTH